MGRPATTTATTTIQDVETDFLICGAGPAGAALAVFLSQHGLRGVMIAAAPSTADTPRAHITNMAALECLRDVGLDRDCLALATSSDCMEHTRWCYSMAGEEYARIHSWGHDPRRRGDYEAASPCEHVDLPQTLLEPVLVERARSMGWDVRFDTALVSLDRGKEEVVSCVRDGVSDATYRIRSRYLFGCDGARSQVVRDLGLPLIKKPGGGVAVNVLIDADLSHLIKSRTGNLHWLIQPDRDHPDYSAMAIMRMVEPWTRWILIVFPKDPEVDVSTVTDAQWMEEVRCYVGDDSIPVKLVSVSVWKVNEIVAERYSEGNVFCLGDAVHRHPPFNGLGSNTCIQDAYNLAWKIAYVHNSRARSGLLDSYSVERQPVGVGVITRANQGFRDHVHVWNALGITESTREQRIKAFNELSAATPAGHQRRADLRLAVDGTAKEFHAVGQEMNQRYVSRAVYRRDEAVQTPPLPEDPVLQHLITTYPGARVPHAWLNTRVPGEKFSTIDLAGHTAFSIFTSIGGDAWKSAATKVSADLGIEIRAYSIGWHQDYEDMYGDWAKRREVAEDGVVLVRPDRFVCWRSMGMIDDCEDKMRVVLKYVLGYDAEE